jgi:hypothetical protein
MEADRLNGELREVTGAVVEKGSQRAALLGWVNGRLTELGERPLADTKADTLSFALDGVPTKAGDEAKEAAKGPIPGKVGSSRRRGRTRRARSADLHGGQPLVGCQV